MRPRRRGVDGQRLHARVRRTPARRGRPRRPLRAQADVRRRHRDLHRGLGRRRTGPDVGALVAARAVQGAGAAIFVPLAMTLLTVATPTERRGRALGAWGGIGGLGAAARTPARRRAHRAGRVAVGLLARRAGRAGRWCSPGRLDESRGPRDRAGPAAAAPVPQQGLRPANAVALLHHAALFGSLFLVTQLLQAGLGAGPLDAGLRLLPMAVMPMLLAPVGGAAADRWGTRMPMVAGVALVAAGAAGLAAGPRPGSPTRALVRAAGAHGRGLRAVLRPVRSCRPRRGPAARAGPAAGVVDDGARGGRRARRRGARARSSPPRRPRLGHAGPSPASQRRCGRRRPRRCGRAGRARPARSPPFPLTDRRPPHVYRLSSGPPGPRTTPRSARCSTSRTPPTPPSRPRRVGRLPHRSARPRPARPRRRVVRRPRRRGDRRLRGVLPRCHRPGPGLAARVGERPRTRGAPVSPRPRRRRRAPPRVGAAHPRVGRAGLRLPHLPVHGHRTGALPADGLRAGPGVRPRHERPLRRARGARPWPALAYLKPMEACPAACAGDDACLDAMDAARPSRARMDGAARSRNAAGSAR